MGFLEAVTEFLKPKKKTYKSKLKAPFVRYIHPGATKTHCDSCVFNDKKIFANDENLPPVGKDNHFWCECKYEEIEQQKVGTISAKGILSPDVYLKVYGKLPDYYITKEEAEKLGWQRGKNLAHFAPGKMMGGNIYNNSDEVLPQKEGRIWYECDVDYSEGKRNSKRLYYSNDGLMFYTDSHSELDVVQIN